MSLKPQKEQLDKLIADVTALTASIKAANENRALLESKDALAQIARELLAILTSLNEETTLDERERITGADVRSLVLRFDNLRDLDAASAQTLIRRVDKAKLAFALKGTSDPLRDFFLKNMTARAAKMLKDEMVELGPVRQKDVEEARAHIVGLADELVKSGQIQFPEPNEGTEALSKSGQTQFAERNDGDVVY